MLTADLVKARRHKGELIIVDLDKKARERARDLAAVFLRIVEQHVGKTRDELEEALAEVDVGPRDKRVGDGLIKLLEDRSDFDAPVELAPDDLRRDVFLRAAAARRELEEGSVFERDRVLAQVGAERGLSAEALEGAMYADLRGSHRLKKLEAASPDALVEHYQGAQAQAVLLKAVRVVVEVRCAAPAAYRALFHKLKFLRLLFSIRPADQGGYRIEIDGPFSLFDAVTKYGLKLALLLPMLEECASFDLVADVRWGKDREPLVFRRKGGRQAGGGAAAIAPRLPDDVAALLTGFRALATPWDCRASTALLSLEGVGLCVPDLVFDHRETKDKIYLEVMGYWSREAVWRRVDLVEKGLSERILFAVSERLRVSEQVLGEGLPGAIYVYKGVMSPRIVADRLEKLRGSASKG